MEWWRQLTQGVRALADRAGADRDVADEVDHYLAEATASFEAAGLSPEEARRAARLELGSVTSMRQHVHEARWEHAVQALTGDCRYAVRRLGRRPVLALACIVTLALGIGSTTAIFSAVHPVLIQPLPYPDAGRLVTVWDHQGGGRLEVTFGTYREVLARSQALHSLAVMRPLQVTLTGVPEPERLEGQLVSADYFRVLGVGPVLGRDFQRVDDRPGAPSVALITDSLWRRRFDGDETRVGRQFLLDDVPTTLAGVLPAGFENVTRATAEIWLPLQYDPALPVTGREWGHHLRLIARLAPGVPLDRARRELDTIAHAPVPEHPRPPWASLDDGFVVNALQDDFTRGVRPLLIALSAAVALVLVLAAVNVTNLLLAEGAARRPDLAVRAALGASRWRLTRQVLTETLVLGLAGGTAGVALAVLASGVVAAMAPPGLPRVEAMGVSGWTLVFAVVLALLVGLVIGIAPVRQSGRLNLYGAVQQHSPRLAGGQRRTRGTLLIVQVAIAVVLLVCTGLLLRSVERLLAVPAGFDAGGLLTLQVQTAGARFENAAGVERFFEDVLDAVRHVPGVSAAAFSSQLPLTGDDDQWGVHLESPVFAAAVADRSAYRYAVSGDYVATMGIPVRSGRPLNAGDVADGLPVAVVSESFAARRLSGRSPVGHRLRIGPEDAGPWFTIVGVVGDVRHAALDIEPADAVYVPAAQWPRFTDRARWLVVRAGVEAAALVPGVRAAVTSVAPDQPIVRVATMGERLRESTAQRRFALLLFQAFAVVALCLAALGTYSLLASDVSERTRELAVRSTFGASRRDIVMLLLRRGLSQVVAGMLLGAAGAAIASRVLERLLFQVSPLDAVSYAGAGLLLAAVAVVACGVPAWRAARLDPLAVLKRD